MQIKFLAGGSVNEFGPFECGQEISLPDSVANDLIRNGLATPLYPVSGKPITITVSLQHEEQQSV